LLYGLTRNFGNSQRIIRDREVVGCQFVSDCTILGGRHFHGENISIFFFPGRWIEKLILGMLTKKYSNYKQMVQDQSSAYFRHFPTISRGDILATSEEVVWDECVIYTL
jgi:hypothetical protein